MAKISRAQGASMSAEEFEAAENVQPNVKIRRPEIVPVRRVRKGEEKSVGTKSSRSTGDKAKRVGKETKSQSEAAPVTENPSPQEEGIHSTVVSADGTVQRTESQPFVETEPPNEGKPLGEPEPEEKPEPRVTKAQGRKPPSRRPQRAPAGAEDETPASTKTANVRFSDDDF